jgi:acetylornithine deacetylase
MNSGTEILKEEALVLLQQLVAIPSFSKEEDRTANCINTFLIQKGITTNCIGNNVFAQNKHFDKAKPTILLNSHHDTVRPNPGYTKNPYQPVIEDGKLFGLGSNDAGGALVSLIAAFCHFYDHADLKYNLIIAATAEEETSGNGGIEAVLPHLPAIDCAIVGEPTGMQLAVAERGLMVLDCIATGRSGHAARSEGDNAVYRALSDIQWIKEHKFPEVSPLLGPVKMSVTVIETGNKAHNVVPDVCTFVVDVRVNEMYSLKKLWKQFNHPYKATPPHAACVYGQVSLNKIIRWCKLE